MSKQIQQRFPKSETRQSLTASAAAPSLSEHISARRAKHSERERLREDRRMLMPRR